jgi:NAD(P)-dependent dehydrogenase (short-subunit alcohol dehydrogenase family)
MKHELRFIRTQGSGVIVYTSLLGGLVGLPGSATCHAAKHGVIGATKSAAMEHATRGIRVNAVCPGVIATPMAAGMDASNGDVLKDVMRDQPIGQMGRTDACSVGPWCSRVSSQVRLEPLAGPAASAPGLPRARRG